MEAVGRISKIFGSDGRLVITLYDTFPIDFQIEEPLFVIIDELAVPLFCDDFQRRGRAGAVIAFADIDTELRATELIGKLLHLNFEEVEPQDEEEDDDGRIYLEDMVGFEATVDGVPGCRIEQFRDGENPLFLLNVSGKEVLVPAVEEFMTEIDGPNKKIVFDLPEGLLDLYM